MFYLVCRSAHDSERASEISSDVDGGDGVDTVLSLCGCPSGSAAVHGGVEEQMCPQWSLRHERH